MRASLGARGADFQTSRESICLPVPEACEAAKQKFNEMCNAGSYGSCRRLCVNAKSMALNKTVELFENCDTECVTEYFQAATVVRERKNSVCVCVCVCVCMYVFVCMYVYVWAPTGLMRTP